MLNISFLIIVLNLTQSSQQHVVLCVEALCDEKAFPASHYVMVYQHGLLESWKQRNSV